MNIGEVSASLATILVMAAMSWVCLGDEVERQPSIGDLIGCSPDVVAYQRQLTMDELRQQALTDLPPRSGTLHTIRLSGGSLTVYDYQFAHGGRMIRLVSPLSMATRELTGPEERDWRSRTHEPQPAPFVGEIHTTLFAVLFQHGFSLESLLKHRFFITLAERNQRIVWHISERGVSYDRFTFLHGTEPAVDRHDGLLFYEVNAETGAYILSGEGLY